MTAVRKIVDSSALTDLFDLPPDFKSRKVEVILFPVDEIGEEIAVSARKSFPNLTKAQVEKWAKAPEIQTLVGALKIGLPADIRMSDIREKRFTEKYGNAR